RWEDRARSQNPRELKYTLRLSSLFLELYRLRRDPSDAVLALRFAESALRINPYGVEALWTRADILAALGKRDDAVKDLEKAVSVEPNFCRGYARLADISGKSGPGIVSHWSAKEEECRRRAATLHLEEAETWMVESPEGR
ncbi:MAG: tetratricopeptide repeat protein, partial [Candidatus Deferrimicrobiaceae bacterium]